MKEMKSAKKKKKVMKKMSVRFAVRVELVLVLLPFILLSVFPCAAAVSGMLCRKAEREALLDFKLSFTADPEGALSSWSDDNPDCCTQWGDRVGCDSDTGHVVELWFEWGELESHRLRPSLLVLQHLTHLDLSGNNFTMRIPEFIGSLTNLEYLDLSYSDFNGKIPPHLGNLTHLQVLSLVGTSLGLLHSDNLQWLSHLSSLQSVDLRGVNLSTATNWVSSLKRLPSLSDFTCRSCSLPHIPQPLSSTCPHNHSTSLQILDLSSSQISFPDFLCLVNGTTSLTILSLASMEQNPDDFIRPLFQSAAKSMLFPVLEFLDISGNQLSEFMHEPQNSSAMPNLGSLYISNNLMTKFPDLSTFSSLTDLDASFNKIHENWHAILQHIPTSLKFMDFSSNSLNGVVSDSYLSKFSNLQLLDFSYNHLMIFKFSHTWVPPFNLADLSLRSCNVGPHFPNWILTQKYLQSLDISNSSILSVIPNAFWNEISQITDLGYLNVSHNKLHGTLPNLSLRFPNGFLIDLSFNGFHGPIPLFLFSATELDLSNNNLSSFSTSYHQVPNNGPLEINLANNLLLGSLPSCIFHFNGLKVLNLAYNKLSGDIPRSIASSRELNALHMNNNRFSGELPSSMKNCTQLVILELGNNNFSGSVPFWIGDSLQQLVVLNLRSNNLTGGLPSNMCNLQRLQLLDMSGNRISGSIPGCVDNFTSMTVYQGFSISYFGDTYGSRYTSTGRRDIFDYASVMWKGIWANESAKMLPQLNVIDLSNNCLTGKIPSGFTSLKYLKSLDLSSNNLTGSIPDKIGELKHMEVLKLSSNKLSGEIPQSLADLTFLDTLNLSSNNLSGKIPKSTQLQSLDPSSYGGNADLCGNPLPTSCPWDNGILEPPRSVRDHAEEEGHGSFDFEAFYAALGAGFASGLFGILGILHFHAPSRHAFFHMASEVGDWIFVWTMLYKSRIKRRLCFSKENDAAKI